MNVLIIRFSALGDVAMTVPVIHSVATQYPQHCFFVLSRSNMAAYFENMPSNVVFKGVDLKAYKGLWGLIKLYWQLRKLGIDRVADLHDVLRTKILRRFFLWAGKKVARIEKGRREKKALVKGHHTQLRTSFQRYAEVFRQLELPVTVLFAPHNEPQDGWIGIAPFAAHPGKVYPATKMREVITLLAKHPDVRIFLFGGGLRETMLLEGWAKLSPQVESVAGKLSRQEELKLMSQLKVMVSMDSANMHLASLVGTPVVSVWGATHPYAGFMGWRQQKSNAIQLDLPCRPCSIYGNKSCRWGDLRCLNGITPQMIVDKVLQILQS